MSFIESISTLIFKFKYRKNIRKSSIIGSKGISIGKGTLIRPFSVLRAQRNKALGEIKLGKNIIIGENAYILAGAGKVYIGDSLHAGNNLILLGGGDITIGNNVLMSHNIAIASSSHDFKDIKIEAINTPAIFKPIVIADNVFIGANATILMGTTIASGAIIGAGSVVLEDTVIGENEVWAGNPATMKYTRVSLEEQIEEEMLLYLKTYPFHNLFSLYNLENVMASEYGGTCSDRTLHFKNKLEEKFQSSNVEIKLHRAFINNQKTHTILRIDIDNSIYFCDVGMGFPITKLLPVDKNIDFVSYGIKFKSVVEEDIITVYMDEGNGLKELMKIDKKVQLQDIVKKEIDERWQNKEDLPFHNCLRYFFIYKNKFYQIKDDTFISI